MTGEEQRNIQKVLKSMDEARDATNLERAEANTTTTILNEKKAAKQKVSRPRKRLRRQRKSWLKQPSLKARKKLCKPR